MAFTNQDVRLTFSAAADLSNFQYRAVRMTGAQQVNVASLNTAKTAVGILLNKPQAAGRAADVAIGGVTKAYAGAAVTAADLLTHDASGYVITATSGTMVLGRALETAGAIGDAISVILHPYFSGDTA